MSRVKRFLSIRAFFQHSEINITSHSYLLTSSNTEKCYSIYSIHFTFSIVQIACLCVLILQTQKCRYYLKYVTLYTYVAVFFEQLSMCILYKTYFYVEDTVIYHLYVIIIFRTSNYVIQYDTSIYNKMMKSR